MWFFFFSSFSVCLVGTAEETQPSSSYPWILLWTHFLLNPAEPDPQKWEGRGRPGRLRCSMIIAGAALAQEPAPALHRHPSPGKVTVVWDWGRRMHPQNTTRTKHQHVVWVFLGGPGFNSQLPIKGDICKGPHGNRGAPRCFPPAGMLCGGAANLPAPLLKATCRWSRGSRGLFHPRQTISALCSFSLSLGADAPAQLCSGQSSLPPRASAEGVL